MASSYRLGRKLTAGYRGVLDYVVYLSSIPGKIEGGLPDLTAPVLVGGSVKGLVLALQYNIPLLSNSVPVPSAFVVNIAATPVDVLNVSIGSNFVYLEPTGGIPPTGTITVSYTPPVDGPITSHAGGLAAAFTDFEVRP